MNRYRLICFCVLLLIPVGDAMLLRRLDGRPWGCISSGFEIVIL
jgi:hypothetical protein